MILSGIIIHNLGVAKQTIAQQKPFFQKIIPEVGTFRNGTINVMLDTPIKQINRYDYYLPQVFWNDRDTEFYEDFGFIKILELMHKSQKYMNWGFLYFPMKSPNRKNNRLLELLGKNDADIQLADRISFRIADDIIEVIR